MTKQNRSCYEEAPYSVRKQLWNDFWSYIFTMDPPTEAEKDDQGEITVSRVVDHITPLRRTVETMDGDPLSRLNVPSTASLIRGSAVDVSNR